MQNYVGADVTSMVTLPVIIFEPMTMLQKMAEVCLFPLHMMVLLFYSAVIGSSDAICTIFMADNGILAPSG